MMTTLNFEVGGLVSSMSARGVEKQLLRLPGVTAVQVNYVAGSASVTFDTERVSPEAIRRAIDTLNEATQELGKALYEEAAKRQAATGAGGQPQQQAGPAGGPAQEAEVKRKGGDVIDAEFEAK